MSIAASRLHAHERGPAHGNERRSPQAGVNFTSTTSVVPSATATDTPASKGVSSFPPTSVKALAGVIAVFGVIILGVALWKILSWKRKRTRRTPSPWVVNFATDKKDFPMEKGVDLEVSWSDMEKPKHVILPPPSPGPGAGWVPQIRSVSSGNISPPQPAKKKSSLRSKSKWNKPDLRNVPEYSPPPVYMASNGPRTFGHSSHSLPPPPPPPQTDLPPPPPSPPVSLKLKITPAQEESIPPPVPSPARSASFAPNVGLAAGKYKLPRLMTVGTTFDPSLEDELLVKVGETVRMLEEYVDEWCLVQRVGKINSPKGVVPRFCLEERPDVVPAFQPNSSSLMVRT